MASRTATELEEKRGQKNEVRSKKTKDGMQQLSMELCGTF